MTGRRKFICAVGAVPFVLMCRAADQNAPKGTRIGYIGGPPLERAGASFTVFRDELKRLGYVDGKNVVIEYRAFEGNLERVPGLVQGLVNQKVDVLVTPNMVATRAAQRATTTIPIVMSVSIDPIAAGVAKSFRQPGGNLTGVYSLTQDLSGKRIELLKELIPGISRIGIVWDADAPGPQQRFRDYLAAAKLQNLDVISLEVRAPVLDFEGLIRSALSSRVQALIVLSNPYIGSNQKPLLALAAEHKLPTIGETRGFSNSGGLVSYGQDLDDHARMLANIVSRVLKGASPANLPIEQPTKFELIVNLKTAKALGIKIPSEIMVRAERVIK